MACEFIYIMFIIYYIVEEALEIIKVGLPYFRSMFNMLDIFVVILSTTNQCLNVYAYFAMEAELEALLGDADSYADFEGLGQEILKDYFISPLKIKLCLVA